MFESYTNYMVYSFFEVEKSFLRGIWQEIHAHRGENSCESADKFMLIRENFMRVHFELHPF